MKNQSITESKCGNSECSIGIKKGNSIHHLTLRHEGKKYYNDCSSKVTKIKKEIMPFISFVIDKSDEHN
jgi:hypothetical protein